MALMSTWSCKLSVHTSIKTTEEEVDNALLSFVVLQQVCQGSGSWEQVASVLMILVASNLFFWSGVWQELETKRLPAMRLWGTTLCFFAILVLSLAPPTYAGIAPPTNLTAQAQELGIAQPLMEGDSTSLHSAAAEEALNPTIKVITESSPLFLSGEILTSNSLLQVTNRGCTFACEKVGFRRWWCSRHTCWDWILPTSKFAQLELFTVHTDKECWWTERGRMMELNGTGAKNNLHISWFSSFKVSFLFQYEMLLV